MNNVEKYKEICHDLACDFIRHIFDREPDFDTLGTDYWISNPGEVLCVNEEYYFDTHLMSQILKNKYSPEDVLLFHDYSVYHSGEGRGYYISISNFIKKREGRSLTEFVDFYHDEVKKEIAYWDSPEGKAKEEKEMEEFQKIYMKKLDSDLAS